MIFYGPEPLKTVPESTYPDPLASGVMNISAYNQAGGAALLIVGNLLVPVDAQGHPPFLELPEPACGMDKATAIMQDTNAACDAGFSTNQCDAPCALQMATLEYGGCAKTITER